MPLALALFAFVISCAACAQTAVPARIADAAWLTGYWEGEGMGGRVEDLWMPPAAGVMLGAFRLVRRDGWEDGSTRQELLRFRKKPL